MRIIIIGGTGMLAQASREISCQANDLVLLSRKPDKLAKDIGARALKMNWADEKAVQASIAKLELEPKVDILISWIHEDGLWCLPLFENLLVSGGRSIRIHGSAVGDPSEGVKSDPPARKDIIRQNVVLGWVEENGRQRWLTNDEISQGALTAFQHPELTSIIVGQIANTNKINPSLNRL